MIQLAILISGHGSNMLKLAEIINQNQLNARISIVISNNNCIGIKKASKLKIPTKIIERKQFTSRCKHEIAISEAIKSTEADYVFLAGYMSILGAKFTDSFMGKLINIHPSLLPSFKGLNTHQRVIETKSHFHGATVHLVTEELDGGPIILQSQLSVLPSDNASSLATRVLRLEHQLYPFVLTSLLEGHLTINDNKVTWNQPDEALRNTVSKTSKIFAKTLRWP